MPAGCGHAGADSPSGVTATAATPSSITVGWNASTDNVAVTGYGLYRNGTSTGSTSSTSASFSGLACGTAYTITVDAYDAAGNRSAKASITASTAACPPPADTQAPTTPGGLNATSATTNSITLTWTASSDNVGVTGYGKYKDGTLISSGTGTTYTYSGLTCGTKYVLAVDAYDAAGNRSGAASINATTTACAPPPTTSGPTTRLAWFYGEPQDGTTAQTLATRNVAWVLSGHQVEDGYLATLKADGLQGSVPGYIELPRTMGPSSCASDPNFAGYTTSWTSWDGEFCTYLNPNESWFLHNSSGQRISSSGGWYYMNPSSSGWRAYMTSKVQRYFTEFPGLDGIFLDDTWNTAATPRSAGCVETICSSDSAWHDATLADLQAIKAAMSQGRHSR